MKVIPHKALSIEVLDQIVEIKQKAWAYSRESHLKWINANIKDDDLHVLIIKEGNIIAYLNLVLVSLEINNQNINGYGIGNVVSAVRGAGYGKLIMESINQYFVDNDVVGFLFCKPGLVAFYRKFYWRELDQNVISISAIDGRKDEVNCMIYNFQSQVESIIYDGPLF